MKAEKPVLSASSSTSRKKSQLPLATITATSLSSLGMFRWKREGRLNRWREIENATEAPKVTATKLVREDVEHVMYNSNSEMIMDVCLMTVAPRG